MYASAVLRWTDVCQCSDEVDRCMSVQCCGGQMYASAVMRWTDVCQYSAVVDRCMPVLPAASSPQLIVLPGIEVCGTAKMIIAGWARESGRGHHTGFTPNMH